MTCCRTCLLNRKRLLKRVLDGIFASLTVFVFPFGSAIANEFPALKWSIGPDLTLASELAEADSNTDNPGRPSIAFDGAKYFLVSQNTLRKSNLVVGILLSRSGSVIRSFPIATATPWYQSPYPRVSFGRTNYLVVFRSNGKIWGTRISREGLMLDEPGGFLISQDSEYGSEIGADLAFDGTDFLVVWRSGFGIVGAKVSPAAQVSNVFTIANNGAQGNPSLAFDGETYLIAWSDNRWSTAPNYFTDIIAARVSKDGTVLDPDGFAVCKAYEDQHAPHVTFGRTNFFVVWVDERNGNYYRTHIYGARITKNGQLLDGPVETAGIPISTSAEAVVNPRAGFDGHNYFATWELSGYQNDHDTNITGIYIARISQGGLLLDAPAETRGIRIRAPDCWACNLAYPEVRFDGQNYFVAWLLNREIGGQTKEIRGTFLQRSNFKVLKSFGSRSGPQFVGPQGILVGQNGRLYVTTREGGLHGKGTVCRLNRDGSAYEIIHHFGATENDGTYPAVSLIEGTDGFLYGTTPTGGRYNGGTVFKLRKNGADYSIVHHYPHSEGQPLGPVLEASNGALYGTAGGHPGNAQPLPTVYRVNKDGSGYKTLHAFSQTVSDHFLPGRFLVEGTDGLLYGTAIDAHGGNIVGFKIQKNGSAYTQLSSLELMPPRARYRLLGWIQGGDSVRYGTGSGGGAYYGDVIARIRNDGSGYGEIYKFEPTNAPPSVSLITSLVAGPDGLLYGTLQYGGELGSGMVFSFAPPGELSGIIATTNGCVTFDVPTQAAQIFVVERSSDLIDWTEFSVARSTNNVLHVQDCPPAEVPIRYYRVRQE